MKRTVPTEPPDLFTAMVVFGNNHYRMRMMRNRMRQS